MALVALFCMLDSKTGLIVLEADLLFGFDWTVDLDSDFGVFLSEAGFFVGTDVVFLAEEGAFEEVSAFLIFFSTMRKKDKG